MKFVLSILLLLITSTYLLPVKELLADKHKICMADMDEQKEDCYKKEKAKEFFNFAPDLTFISCTYNVTQHYFTPAVTTLLHTVETPPPDIA